MGCCASLSDDSNGDSPIRRSGSSRGTSLKRTASRRSESVKLGWIPVVKRSCTDVIALVIYILFGIGILAITCYSFWYGDAWRLAYGYDSWGNVCGRTNKPIPFVELSGRDMTNYKYVFFLNTDNPLNSKEICVSKCPTVNISSYDEMEQYEKNGGDNLCRYDKSAADAKTNGGICAKIPVRPTLMLMNRCFPKFTDFISISNASDVFHRIFNTLATHHWIIFSLMGIGLLLSLVMVFIIRYLASVIIFLVMILAGVASIGATAALWYAYSVYNRKLVDLRAETNSSYTTAFLVFAILATIFTVVLLLVMLASCKRVRFLNALFTEAGICLSHMPFLVFQPVWTAICLIVYLAFWVMVMLYLATSSRATYDVNTDSVHYNSSKSVRYLWWYMIFGLIWVSEFILACQNMVIAGAVNVYYFTRKKRSISNPILKSISRLLFFHLGSVALGSLIITLVKIPRLVLMWINAKLEGKESCPAKFVLKCLICCLYCLENCLKYIASNAYAIIAIDGVNFFPACQRAFEIIVDNAFRVATINCVGDFVLFLAKLIVTGVVGMVGVLWFSYYSEHPAVVPVVLSCVFAFFIAHCFISLYETVIDTLLICFCEDCNTNDGSPSSQYFMSNRLKDFVDRVNNKAIPIEGQAAVGATTV